MRREENGIAALLSFRAAGYGQMQGLHDLIEAVTAGGPPHPKQSRVHPERALHRLRRVHPRLPAPCKIFPPRLDEQDNRVQIQSRPARAVALWAVQQS